MHEFKFSQYCILPSPFPKASNVPLLRPKKIKKYEFSANVPTEYRPPVLLNSFARKENDFLKQRLAIISAEIYQSSTILSFFHSLKGIIFWCMF